MGFATFPNSADAADKSFTISLSFDYNPDSMTLGSRTTATVVIRDNDPTVVSLAKVGSATAINEGQKVEFTVTLGRALIAGEIIDVPLVIGGTGVTTGDWSLAKKSGATNTGVALRDTGTATPKVRFSGAGAQTATLELMATDDGTSDSGETFNIALGADSAFDAAGLGTNVGGGADPHGTNNDFSVTVNEVPTTPTLSIDLGQSSIAEGNSGNTDVTINYRMSPAHSARFPFWACVDTANSTATHRTASGGKAADWNLVHFHSLSPVTLNADSGRCHLYNYPANGTLQNFKVRVFGDTTAEGNETAVVTIKRAPGTPAGIALGTSSATLTINNDDGAVPTVTISGGAAVTEGTGAQFTVNASPAPAANLTVDLTVTDAAGSSDFVAATNEGAKTVEITGGQTSATYTVPTEGDQVDEPNGLVTVAIGTVAEGYTRGTPSSATTAVNDDDGTADTTAPRVTSIARQTPSSSPTDADTLTWRVTFDEAVQNVDAGDFTISGTTATLAVSPVAGTNAFDVTASGGDLAGLNATVTLGFASGQNIEDTSGNALTNTTPTGTNDNSFVVDNSSPPPAVTVKFSSAAYKVSEGEAVTVGVTLSGTRSSATAITIFMTPISATGQGVDFDDSNLTITVPAGRTSATGTIRTHEDTSVEGDEQFRMDIVSLPAGVTAGTPAISYVTIEDDDFPTLSVSLGSTSGNEGDSGSRFVDVDIALSPAHSANTRFLLCAKNTGTATFRNDSGDKTRDFDLTGRNSNTGLTLDGNNCHTYNIGRGGTSSGVSLRIFGDTDIERDETAVVELRRHADTPSQVKISPTAGTATYTIRSDDIPSEPTLSLAPPATTTVAENGAPVEFTLDVSLPYFTPMHGYAHLKRSGSANRYGDYRLEVLNGAGWRALHPAVSLVPVPRERARLRLRLVPLEDGLVEQAETVTFTLLHQPQVYRNLGLPYTRGTPHRVTFTLTDTSPALPVASFAAAASNPAENAGTQSVTVTLDKAAPAGGLTLHYRIEGTATRIADYTIAGSTQHSGTVAVAAGATTASFTVTLVNDSAGEPDETVILTLLDREGYTPGTAKVHSLTIADNDGGPPRVTVSAGTLGLAEGGAAGSYTVALASRPSADVTVTASSGDAGAVRVNGPGGAPGASATLTFTPTTWNAAQTVTVTPQDDADADDESVTVAHAVSNTGGYGGVTAPSVTVSVDDDETPAAPILSVAIAPASAAEGAAGAKGYATVTFRIDPTRSQATGFKACLKNTGTASRGGSADYLFVGPSSDTPLSLSNACHSYTLPANAASGQARLLIRGDGEVEPNETVVVELRDPPQGVAVSGAMGTATYTIVNDDSATTDPEITVTGGNGIAEGGNAVFTVRANPAPAADLNVTVTVSEDTSGGRDFVAASVEGGGKTVTIPGGQTSKTYGVPTVQDTTDEPDGGVTVTVDPGSGYRIGSPDAATVPVSDDDDPVVRIAGGGSITEGGNAVFTLTATPPPAADITVRVEVTETGSFAGSGQTGTRPATILAGQASATLTVGTDDDTTDEANGGIMARVLAGSGYAPHSTGGSASVAVADDDTAPVVGIAGGGDITEGGTATFTLTATPPPAGPITVQVNVTERGSFALSGQTGTRPVTVGTGGTGTLSVTTDDDNVDETAGFIRATVVAGAGYTPSTSAHRSEVSVADNDLPTGAPGLSVNDVTVQEGPYRRVEFTVTLSEATRTGAWFQWRVRESDPVSARRNVDFGAPGLKTYGFIRPNETEYRILAAVVIDDSHNEGNETFEIVLSDAHGATIADGVGVATIVNDDPMPAAWLARFGRTVAEQALDGIAGRIAAPRTAGAQGTIAGQSLNLGTGSAADGAANDNAPMGGAFHGMSLAQSDVARAFGASADRPGSGPGQAFGGGYGLDDTHGLGQSRTMTGLEALLGSSFTATGETDGTGGSLAFWGRAAQSSFDGREGTFSLDGETTTAMLGADYARGKWLVGLALMQSSGEGGYADAGTGSVRCPQDLDAETRNVLCGGAVREGDGTVEASLTAAVPYAAIQASERLRLWGALGHGAGEVTLKTGMGQSLGADISWSMAAAGLRGDVIAPPKEGSGPALAVTSDALWARTGSDETHELAASESDVTRLRLGLEGSWKVALDGEGSVTPKLEIGVRHDGGDAETGSGLELGGGIAWVDPALGLSLDLSGRTLIAHGNDDLKDRGFAASLAFDPDPATKRGLSLALRQEIGGQAKGGLDALFRTDPLADRTGSAETASRWQAEAAWGFPAFSGRFTGSPHVGLGLATGARDYTLGWRLTPAANANAPDLSFGVKATRRENDTAAPEHTVGFEINARW